MDKPQIQKAQKTPRKINLQKTTTRKNISSYIIFKLQWSKNKEKMLEKQEKEKNNHLNNRGTAARVILIMSPPFGTISVCDGFPLLGKADCIPPAPSNRAWRCWLRPPALASSSMKTYPLPSHLASLFLLLFMPRFPRSLGFWACSFLSPLTSSCQVTPGTLPPISCGKPNPTSQPRQSTWLQLINNRPSCDVHLYCAFFFIFKKKFICAQQKMGTKWMLVL